eukprot:m.13457 g.13457  ORF g.13457 m.13457 type:complete len:1013 (-) comp4664_c0_seq1:146-3184(-)
MGDTSEQVVALLNRGMVATTASDKVTVLQQVQELTVEKQPELLDNFFDEILQFQHDRNLDVRKQVIAFVEVACKKDARLLPRAVPTLRLLLQDEAAAVKKRAILANTNLYRPVLLTVATANSKTLADPSELWGAMEQMKAEIVTLLRDGNDGVRTSVLKFLELQILAQTLRTAASETKKGDTSGLEVVPADHPVLNAATLREDGRVSFELLVEKLTAEDTSSSNVLAVITIVASIARLRPSYMERTIRALVDLFEDPPTHLKATQVTSIKRALKTPLTALLKHPASAEFHEILIPVLEELEVPYTTISQFDRRGDVSAKEAAAAAKPMDVDAPAAGASTGPAAGSAAAMAVDPSPSIVSYAQLRQLPFPLVIELLMQCMKNLPDTMPPLAAAAAPAATTSAQPTAPGGPAVTASVGGAAGAAVAGGSVPDAPVQPGKRAKMEGGAVGTAAPPAAERRHKKRYKLEAVVLSEDTRHSMTLGAFKRLLGLEGKMTEEGARQSRELLIARMAAMISNSDVLDALVAYIMQAPKERANLALLWLYHQYRAVLMGGNEEEKAGCMEWYNLAVEKLLIGLWDTLDSRDRDHLVPKILLEMPHFPPSALAILQSYCEDLDEGRTETGFIAMHFLLKYRPPMREQALPVLLKYTRSVSEQLRRRSMKVARKFWKVQSMREEIETFAVESMEILAGITDATVQQFPSELMRIHLELQFELCAEDPCQLMKIVHVYTATKLNAVKTEIMRSMTKVDGFDWSNPALLKSLNEFPEEGQDLLLFILHVLTKKDRPSPALMVAVRKVFDRTKDQRLLISILRGMSKSETIGVLPTLLGLKDSLVQEVFTRVLGGAKAAGKGGALSPSEFLVTLHSRAIGVLDAVKAVNRCFDKRYAKVFTHEVLAVSLQQLVDQTPLPVNLMRTMIQALTAVPRLKGFIVSLLIRLSTKDIWTNEKMWKGFVRLCLMTAKESYDIVLNLPKAQLEAAAGFEPKLKDDLVAYVSKFPEQQRSTLPPATLELLGLDS